MSIRNKTEIPESVDRSRLAEERQRHRSLETIGSSIRSKTEVPESVDPESSSRTKTETPKSVDRFDARVWRLGSSIRTETETPQS